MTATAATAEGAREILHELVKCRKQLQNQGADSSTLEANRLAIVYWQRQLARAQHTGS
jgi:hypothetical protein